MKKAFIIFLLSILSTEFYAQCDIVKDKMYVCANVYGIGDTNFIEVNSPNDAYRYQWSTEFEYILKKKLYASTFLDDTTSSNPKFIYSGIENRHTQVFKLKVFEGEELKCEDSIEVIISKLNNFVLSPLNQVILEGECVKLNYNGAMGGFGELDITWYSHPDIADSLENEPLVCPKTTTRYNAFATDSVGCRSDDSYSLVEIVPNNQKDKKFAKVGTRWVYHNSYWINEMNVDSTLEIYVEKDTLINNMIVCRKVITNPDLCQQQGKKIAYIYEREDKVYILNPFRMSSYLLYDFTKEVGESWVINEEYSVEVLNVYYKEINGEQVKTMNVRYVVDLPFNTKPFYYCSTISRKYGDLKFLINTFYPETDCLGSLTPNGLESYTDSLGTDKFEHILNANGNCVIDGLKDKKALSALTLIPNPTSDFLQINGLNAFENNSIQVLNNNGQLIQDFRLVENKIDVSALATGIYFVKIRSLSSSEILKFIKN